MKISFKKQDLVNALNISSKAVAQRTTMPILECILIEANEDGVSFTANDMELGINTKISSEKCNVIEGGRTAVEAKLFFDIIRKISSDDGSDIIFTKKDSIIEISCDNSLFKIQERDADQFPVLELISDDKYISVSQFTLKEVIKDTIFSISQNDSNKMMTGELFEVKGDNLKVVSLDGHRISIKNTKLRDNYESVSVIIPGKTLSEISKILPGDADKDVTICFSHNSVQFRFDDTVMISRLIDGEFFRIENMIRPDYDTKVVINKKELLDSIERSTILVRESDKRPLIFNIEDSSLSLRMSTVIGSMDDKLLIRKEGKDLMIGFNPRFLLDALRVIDDEEVSLYMTNAKSPLLIRDAEDSYVYLILPVNFNAYSY